MEITPGPQNRVIVQEMGQNRPKLCLLMTDMEAHLGVQQPWKSLWDPNTVSNSPRNGPESAKTVSVDDQHVNAPRGPSIVEITPGPETGE